MTFGADMPATSSSQVFSAYLLVRGAYVLLHIHRSPTVEDLGSRRVAANQLGEELCERGRARLTNGVARTAVCDIHSRNRYCPARQNVLPAEALFRGGGKIRSRRRLKPSAISWEAA